MYLANPDFEDVKLLRSGKMLISLRERKGTHNFFLYRVMLSGNRQKPFA